VRQALACGNVRAFFRLYLTAPRLGRRLMDAAVKQLRFVALSKLVRAHKPTLLPLPFLASVLGFVAAAPDAAAPAAAPAAAAAAGAVVDGDTDMSRDGDGTAAAAASAAPVPALQAQLGALTVDDSGALLPGCSEERCAGDFTPSFDVSQGLAACLEWCKQHGAMFDQETGAHARAMWVHTAEGTVCAVCCGARLSLLRTHAVPMLTNTTHHARARVLLLSSPHTDLPSAGVATKECWSRLFVPVDTTKVAHGDVNLDIRDFLAAVAS
jgi:hypothetical protein